MSKQTTESDDLTPEEMGQEARNTALGAVDEASDLGVAKRAAAEQQAATDFARTLSEALMDGLSTSQMGHYCSVLADESKYYNKTELVDLVERTLEELRVETQGKRPLNEIIENDLTEVIIVRTTDAKQSTLYRWHFVDGCSLETRSTDDGRTHFSWFRFRDEYFDAAGVYPAKPPEHLRGGDEWREFIVAIIDERGEEQTTIGPRTAAVDALQNFVRRSRAFGDIEHMVDYDGVYLDADPEEAEPSELWIPNDDIKRICDDNELSSTRALQVELEARGHTVGRVNGVSESTFVNNAKVSYWVLDAALAEPSSYEADPRDPAEQLQDEAEAEAESEDGEPGEDGEGGESEDDEGSNPGAIGSIGEDPDDDDDPEDEDAENGGDDQ